MSLAELVVAMGLMTIVGSIVVALLRTESRLAGHAADRAEALDATRTAGAIFTAELTPLEPGTDLHGIDADSVRLRVFRGAGVVCGFAGADPLVRYRGLRQPDPAKDSVLVPTAAGGERADTLHAATRAPSGCVARDGEAVFRLGTPAVLREGDAVIVFETGSYYADHAFRYRRGSGGRQPITADVFTTESRLAAWPSATGGVEGVALELIPATSTRTIRGAPIAERARVRVTLRNRARPRRIVREQP